MTLSDKVERHWYQPRLTALTLVLAPLALCFGGVVWARRCLYRKGILSQKRFSVPVIVVGNLTVGGTGKTPMVIWLTQWLREKGYRPGIVARGAGSLSPQGIHEVRPDSDPLQVGDEAVLVARRTGCPMVTGKDRVKAVQTLLETTDCNVVLSDDGLQHYRLGRTFEIILVDGTRAFGNGWLLPAGPMRESHHRLSEAGMVFFKGKDFTLEGETLVSLRDPRRKRPVTDFLQQRVHAVAGISHPEMFFSRLRERGLEVVPHVFPDHHAFRKEDIRFADGCPVIMTEKDAIKCDGFADENHWVLPVGVVPGANMLREMEKQSWSI